MNINIYNPYVRREMELYHHGIFGMKWGKKNGPPYPLDDADHSASEKKAGWKDSLEGGGKESRAERKARKYKEKELKKIDKAYQKDRKLFKHYDDETNKKIENRISTAENIEKQYVMNMSIDDIREEQKWKGRTLASRAMRVLTGGTNTAFDLNFRRERMSSSDRNKLNNAIDGMYDDMPSDTTTERIGKYDVEWDETGEIVNIKDENGKKVDVDLFDIDWDDDSDQPILNKKPSRKK